MGRISWYKRNPDAALNGMFELTLEQRGAYNTVLDLIYSRANQLPDDDRFIAGWLRCDVRVWRRLKGELVAAGKLRIEDGLIRNDRADEVVDEALSRVVSASEAGKASARKRAQKPNENNVIALTVVPTGVSTNKSKSKSKSNSSAITEKVTPSCRLSADATELIEAWNELAKSTGSFRQARASPTKNTANLIRLRIKEYGAAEIIAALRRAARNDWVKEKWRPDIASMMAASKCERLIAGLYDPKVAAQSWLY